MINIEKQKILLIRNDNIGDLICTTPAIEALRKKYPQNQIDIVVNSYNIQAIQNNPFISNIYCYTKTKHKNNIVDKIKAIFGKLNILLKIKKEKYNVVIIFRNSYSNSAGRFAKITKAKYQVGVKSQNLKDSLNISIQQNHGEMHEVEFCFKCLQPFGVHYAGEKTRYYVPESLINKYHTFNSQIIFHISARMKNNQMSFDKLKEIIQNIGTSHIYITAEPKDFDMAIKLENDTQAKFLKTASFIDYAGLLKNAKILITLEGGAMHLGPAVGTVTIALFGQSLISRWYPWGYKDLTLQDASNKAENIPTQQIIKLIGEITNE